MATDGVQYNGMQLNDYLKKLDAKDGKVDNKIDASVWNSFAENVGAQHLRKGDSISVFQAAQEASPLISGDTPEMRQKQAAVRTAATAASKAGYSVSGEMMRISLTPDALTIGSHAKDGYSVVSPDAAQSRLEALGLKEGDNGHMDEESMRLKMVEFKPGSAVSKGLSSSSVVQNAVQNWYNQGAKASGPIAINTFDKKNWHSADDADSAFGVGYSYIVGLHDNGDGTVSGYVEDVYDFSQQYNSNSGGGIDKVTGKMLEQVCELQDVGKVQNYRTLTPITIRVSKPQGSQNQTWSQKAKDAVRPLTTQSQREALSGVASVGSAVVDGAETAVDAVSDAATDAGKYVKQKAKQAWNKVKNWF